MLISTNIDRSDEAINTKNPFQWQCPLMLQGVSLPLGCFVSIRVHMSENLRPPARLHRIKTKGNLGSAMFCDANGEAIGSFMLAESADSGLCSSFIRTDAGVIAGQLTYSSELPSFLLTGAKKAGGTLETGQNDFKLLPQCHVPVFKGIGKAITIGGVTTNGDATLVTGTRTRATLTDEGFEVGLASKYTSKSIQNGIETIIIKENGTEVDRTSLKGNHLILTAGVASNLRVVVGANDINLKGVLDV